MTLSKKTVIMLSVTSFIVMLNVAMLCDVMLNVITLSVIMLNVIMLSVFMLNVIILSDVMINVIMLSVVMLNAIMLSVVMLNVIILSDVMLNVIMLSVVMLSVIMLNVAAPTEQPIFVPKNNDDSAFLIFVKSKTGQPTNFRKKQRQNLLQDLYHKRFNLFLNVVRS
jgi:hypothetical protein